MSRTPLREALRLLLAEDLVDQLPTGGMVVRSLSAQEIDELYTVRAALEGLMAAEAAERMTDEAAAALTRLVARNERLVEFAEDAMNAGHDFHLEIAEIAGTRLGGEAARSRSMVRWRATGPSRTSRNCAGRPLSTSIAASSTR